MNKSIKITKYDPFSTVEPWVEGLGQYLSCVRKTSKMVEDDSGNLQAVPCNVKEYMFSVAEEGDNKIGVIFPGITEYAVNILKNLQYDVEVVDKQSPVPEADFSRINLRNPREGQKEALALISATRHAIIDAPGGWGKSTLIEQVCRMYPDLNILVVTSRSSVRDQLYERIRDTDDKHTVQLVKPGRIISKKFDVLVMSDKSLHRVADGWADLLIYDEAHNAGSEQACRCLNRFTGIRTIGLSATPTGRQDGTDLQTKALLGPVRMRIPYQTAVKDKSVVPISVDVYPVNSKDFGIKSANAKTRICIVRNTHRHKIVAQVARAAVPATEQLLIIAASTEHVLRMRKYLPEAVPIYRTISQTRYEWFHKKGLIDELSPQKVDVSAVKKGFLNGDIRVVLSTSIWSEGVDFPYLKYLIKADGLGSPINCIQIAYRLSRIAENKEEGKLITFIDRYDGLHRRAYKQIKEYRSKGWNVSYKQKLPIETQW